MEENLKINEEILEQVAEFMVAILYDKKREYPLFQSELKDEDICKIRKTMLDEFKNIAKDTDTICLYAHYNGDKLLDEIFKKSDINFRGGLISLMVYPHDFCCTIHKNYATYSCNPGMDLDKKYKVPETIIALTQEGAKRIIEQANKKINELTVFPYDMTKIKKRKQILKQIKKVEDYLNKNNISTMEEKLEDRIMKLDNFKPKYDSWNFLYEDKKEKKALKNYKKIIKWTSEYITALLYDNYLVKEINDKDLKKIKDFIEQKLKDEMINKTKFCVDINELIAEVNNNVLNCFAGKINDNIYIYRDYSVQVTKSKSGNKEKIKKIIALTEEKASEIMDDINSKIEKLVVNNVNNNSDNKEEIKKLIKRQQSVEKYLKKHELKYLRKHGLESIEELKKHEHIYGS